MTEASRRSAHDIDLWTRAFAEEQARRSGMPVRAWLEAFVARETARAAADAPATMNGWRPAREAFGQRTGRPEAAQTAEATQASAAAILARSVDDAETPGRARVERAGQAVRGKGPADEQGLGDELGIRARVSRPDADGRRPSDSDVVETEPLSEVERALRDMRQQMDAAVLLVATAARPPG